MRLLVNGSSVSELKAINPIQEVRALYIGITSYSALPRSLDYNPHIFHTTMLLSHPLSEKALFVASHTPLARFPILPTKSFSSMSVLSCRPGSSHAHILQGTADKTVPYKYTSKIQALVPQAKLVTIADGGHDITVTHAKEVNSALLHFLSGGLASNIDADCCKA